MKVDFEIIIKSGDEDVDMDNALKTLAGTSSTITSITDTILNGSVIERRTSSNDIRTKLKQSFKSSYGQNFSIEINKPDLAKKLKQIGKESLSEIISYYINESLYIESKTLSNNAQAKIKELEDVEIKLLNKIKNPIIEMHKITISNGYEINLFCKQRGEKFSLAHLNSETAKKITATEVSTDESAIEVAITRFNNRTGNGRLILKNNESGNSIPFGFRLPLKKVPSVLKKLISENLHANNPPPEDELIYITLFTRSIKDTSGAVVKYLISPINIREI